MSDSLRRSPLDALHTARGARMTAFAGWSLPLAYPAGALAEHAQARERAALFDVSHMGQIALRDARGVTHAAEALEALVPASLAELPTGRARYAFFTDEGGGVLDDLIVSNVGDHLFLVVNAARADADLALLRDALHGVSVERLDRALLALQGPAAGDALARIAPESAALRFMETTETVWDGKEIRLSRLGYTGEDGFEISLPPDRAAAFAEALLSDERVALAGLGARDTLRMEAGLPLWGADLDATTTPAEAGLGWAIPERRRRAADFPGAATILAQLRDGPPRRLVGLRPEGRALARGGTEARREGRVVGRVTSGGYGPTVGGPISLGYLAADAGAPGAAVDLIVRGAPLPARVVALPFVPHRYRRA